MINESIARKAAVVLVVTAMVLLSLVGATALAQSPVTIVHLACGCHGNAFNDILSELAEEFNASQSDVRVEIGSVAGNYDDAVQVMAAAGNPGDVLHLQNQNGASMTDILLNMTHLLQRDGIDASKLLVPHAVEGLNVRGHQYSLPIFAQPRGLGYRPDLFERGGLESPSVLEAANSWDWAAFAESAKRLTIDRNGDGEIDQWGTTLSRNRTNIQARVRSAGVSMFDRIDTPTQASFTDPQVIETIQSYLDVKHVNGSVSPESFQAGNTAMFPGIQPGHILNYANVDFEWDIAEMPRGSVTRAVHTSFNGVQISATDPRKQEAAWQWVKFLVFDPEPIRKFMVGTGRTPALIEALPDYLRYVEFPEGRTSFVPAMSYAQADIMSPHITEINRIWNQEFQPVWDGEASLFGAMTRIQDMVNALLSQH